jgi:hypothetical protein
MARLSAAKARVSQRRVYEQRSVWQRVARSWQLIRVIWNAVGKIVLQLAGLLAFALIGVLLWKTLTQKTIAIAPISVPKMLAENGYSAEVAAQRLHDALNKVVREKTGQRLRSRPIFPASWFRQSVCRSKPSPPTSAPFSTSKAAGIFRGSSQLHKSSSGCGCG